MSILKVRWSSNHYLSFKEREHFHNQILEVVAKRSEVVANGLAVEDGL